MQGFSVAILTVDGFAMVKQVVITRMSLNKGHHVDYTESSYVFVVSDEWSVKYTILCIIYVS